MKIEWLIADETSVGPPVRAEHDLLGIILNVCCPIQPAFVLGGQFCDMGTS